MGSAPDYPTVQAALTANLLRHGVLENRIERDQMPEWARVLADLAAAPVVAERDRYAAALDEIQTLQPDWIGGPQSTLDRAKEIARKAREGTGQ